MMSATARLADYVLPPPLMFERDDSTMAHNERSYFPTAFAHYAPAIAAPPAGSELAKEHLVFWGLAKRLGKAIEYDGVPLDMETPPTAEVLLAIPARNGQVPFARVKAAARGTIFDVETQHVQPAREGSAGRFELLPADVAAEFAAMAAGEAADPDFPHRLVVRRMREVMNSFGQHIPSVRRRRPANLVQVHPDDLAALGIKAGDAVRVESRRGGVETVAEADPTLRPGVVSMTHGWGGLPGDRAAIGAAINRLTDSDDDLEAVNAMPRFSDLPVRLRRAG
jgi:anaerobic selenocysteine-containing dehydrogenase